MSKKKSKKVRRLAVAIFPSGIVGKGKSKVGVVKSTLTPRRYEERFYHSDLHFRTEAAIEVRPVKKGYKVPKKYRKYK